MDSGGVSFAKCRADSLARFARPRQAVEVAFSPAHGFAMQGIAGDHLYRAGLKFKSAPAMSENSARAFVKPFGGGCVDDLRVYTGAAVGAQDGFDLREGADEVFVRWRLARRAMGQDGIYLGWAN